MPGLTNKLEVQFLTTHEASFPYTRLIPVLLVPGLRTNRIKGEICSPSKYQYKHRFFPTRFKASGRASTVSSH